jgi:hypothetical protein
MAVYRGGLWMAVYDVLCANCNSVTRHLQHRQIILSLQRYRSGDPPHLPLVGQANCNMVRGEGGYTKGSEKTFCFQKGAVDGRFQHVLYAIAIV